jgi:hypothetical protein
MRVELNGKFDSYSMEWRGGGRLRIPWSGFGRPYPFQGLVVTYEHENYRGYLQSRVSFVENLIIRSNAK